MSSILALPPPSSLPSSSTYGRAKALLASDALPVTPIRPTPDEERRQQLRRAAAEEGSAAVNDEAGRAGAERAGAGAVGGNGRRASQTVGGEQSAGVGEQYQARPNVDLQTLNAGPVAGYVAQSLYQESMGSGLHIEPWSQALGAYRRADSAGFSSTRMAFSV